MPVPSRQARMSPIRNLARPGVSFELWYLRHTRIHGDPRAGDVPGHVIDMASVGIVDVQRKGASVAVATGRERVRFTKVDDVEKRSGGGVVGQREMVELECQESGLSPHAHAEVPGVGSVPAGIE